MYHFKESKFLPYRAESLQALVLDIEHYPEFLPWCTGARIFKRTRDLIIADLLVRFKIFSSSYRSTIRCYRQDTLYVVDVKSSNGPFEFLHNVWTISPHGADGSELCFSIDFSLKSSFLNVLGRSLFDMVTKEMVRAFEQRAKIVCV